MQVYGPEVPGQIHAVAIKNDEGKQVVIVFELSFYWIVKLARVMYSLSTIIYRQLLKELACLRQ